LILVGMWPIKQNVGASLIEIGIAIGIGIEMVWYSDTEH
jgi:hypothetical protein